MSQFPTTILRTDTAGYSTSIKPLGHGRYGARVYLHGRVVDEDNKGSSRAEAAANLRAMLRMLDKCGNPSPMASASRYRNYCR